MFMPDPPDGEGEATGAEEADDEEPVDPEAAAVLVAFP
jgi:hypothetical protein